jgi:hypothetical protein
MANPEQTIDLGLDDGGLEDTDLELLEGMAGGEGRDCGTRGEVRTLWSRDGIEKTSIEKRKPLNLLDLPVDVLKDIIKEVRGVALNTPYFRAPLLTLSSGYTYQ